VKGRFPEYPDEEFFLGPLDPAALFGRDAPLEVELGTGKARFLIEAARAHPDRNFLGVERSLSYYRFARDRVARAGLPNARVLRADAAIFVARSLPEGAAAFHAYFLDPWPKKRQRKRRLLDAPFLDLLARRLAPGGQLLIKTDHADYAEAIEAALRVVPALEELPWPQQSPPPATHYEIKYGNLGRPIWKKRLRKRPAKAGPPTGEDEPLAGRRDASPNSTPRRLSPPPPPPDCQTPITGPATAGGAPLLSGPRIG
jgi:tRNA (guanine-N7-)-methyltransferase